MGGMDWQEAGTKAAAPPSMGMQTPDQGSVQPTWSSAFRSARRSLLRLPHCEDDAMSQALNIHASSLNQSARTLPDISLGSLNESGFSLASRHPRVPSTSSGTSAPSTAPIGTPPLPTNSLPFSRKAPYNGATPKFKRMASGLGASALGASFLDDEDADGGVLNTPDAERRWGLGAAEPVTPTAKLRASKAGGGSKAPTLRDQERVRTPY